MPNKASILFAILFLSSFFVFTSCDEPAPTPLPSSCDDRSFGCDQDGVAWQLESVGTALRASEIADGNDLKKVELLMKGVDGSSIEILLIEAENPNTESCLTSDKTWSTNLSKNYTIPGTQVSDALIFIYTDPLGNVFESRNTIEDSKEGFLYLSACDEDMRMIEGDFSFVIDLQTAAGATTIFSNGSFESLCLDM